MSRLTLYPHPAPTRRATAMICRATFESLETRRLLTVLRPDHIVIVWEQDRLSDQIGGTVMPYLNSLAANGLFYSNSHGVTHPSEPNTIAFYSGSTQNVTDNGRIYTFSGTNVAKTLFGAGFSFSAFVENLPSDGSQVSEAGDANYADLYTRNMNAAAQFTDVGTISGNPRPNSAVNKTFASYSSIPTSDYSSLPTVSLIIPNNLHSTHGSNVAYPWAGSPDETNNNLLRQMADTWLQTNIDPYYQWAKTHNSLLIVMQDEERWTGGTALTTTTVVNGSTNLFQSGVNSSNINHYNILRTIEDMYGLTLINNTSTSTPLQINASGQLAPDSITTLASSTNPSVFGQSTTFTATVTSVSGTPTGTVTFKDGTTTLGTGTLDASGIAALAASSLTAGSHSITAVYGGDATHAGSTSAALTQTVSAASTTTGLTTSATPTVFGQSVTFTATVAPVSPGAGTPTGTVTFKDGATTLGTGTLNGSGVATFSTSSLSVTSHSITALYGATTNFATSTSSAVTQVVNAASTSTALTSSANPSVFGQSVTFTATVTATSPGSGIPTGTVTFKDGANTIGTVTLDGSGAATWTGSSWSVASHSITVVYNGSTNFATSTSSTLTQVVNAASTATALTSSGTPSLFNTSVTFTATVTAVSPGSGIPSGTVTFKDGVTTLGTGTLNGSGVATFSTSSLTVASHSITAVYGGSTNYTTSTSSVFTQVVNPQSVTQIYLVDCDTHLDITSVTLTPAGPNTINLANLPPHLAMRAETSPATVGSVKFGYDANSNQRIENTAPYFLNGDYVAFNFTIGNHTITATPYSATNATGTAGTAMSIPFTVTNPSATPAAPDLAAASDLGTLATDNITKANNALQFTVGSTVSGATVKIYSDGSLVGSAVTSGTSTTVTTNVALTDGPHNITATQTETGKNESAASTALSVTIDTAAPAADVVDVSPDPRNTSVANIGINFNDAVAGFDLADMSLTRDGGANLLTSQGLTSGNNIGFTLDTLSGITAPAGNYLLTLNVSNITDVAGNALAASAADGFAVNVIAGDATPNANDAFRLTPVVGDPNSVNIFINNNTATPDYIWTFTTGDQLVLNGLGGNDSLLITAPLAVDVIFNGGTQSGGGDSMQIVGDGGPGSYTPAATTGSGAILLGARSVQFTGLEPVTISNFASFSLITPSAADAITIDNPSTSVNRISGTSGGVAFESLSFSSVASFTLDAGANDGVGADDTVTIASPGLVATGLNSFSLIGAGGNDTLNLNGGALAFSADASATTSNLTLNVAAGASATFNTSQHLAALNLFGVAALAANGSRALVVNSFTNTGGSLDLADNDMIVRSPTRATIEALVGTGAIYSSSAATIASHATALGVIQASDSSFTTFDAQTVSSTDVLVKYTYKGDTTLDGAVTFDDFNRFLAGSNGQQPARWFTGDLDFNGFVNFDDFNKFIQGLNSYNATLVVL